MSKRYRARYVALCIPGDRDDLSEDWWYVYDARRRRTRLVVGEGVLHEEAAAAAAQLNRGVPRAARTAAAGARPPRTDYRQPSRRAWRDVEAGGVGWVDDLRV